MKRLNLFVPILAAVAALFAGTASAADEKEDILARFDRELLIVMSGFYEAREATVATPFRQTYLTTFNQFVRDGELLQKIFSELNIGEDFNLGVHVQNIRTAFQNPEKEKQTGSTKKSSSRKKDDSSAKTANDPLARLTGKSISDFTGLGPDGSKGPGAILSGVPIGFSFHMIGNAIQTGSSLGFAVRNGKYTVAAKYRNILPYLEFKRNVEYFNHSYEQFDALIDIQVWRTDFEKRLKRMVKLAIQIQPVYRAYFPDKTISATREAERLSRVFHNYVEYVRIENENQKKKTDGGKVHPEIMRQMYELNYQEKGQILKDYDTAASALAEFIADMDSIDWTVKPFSADASAADGTVNIPAKTSN